METKIEPKKLPLWFWSIYLSVFLPPLLDDMLPDLFREVSGIIIFLLLAVFITIFYKYALPYSLYIYKKQSEMWFQVSQMQEVLESIHRENETSVTSVIKTIPREHTLIFLLRASPFFSHNIIVSIYVTEGEYERLIGIGTVYNVQENDIIQVKLHRAFEETHEVFEQIRRNDNEVLNRILVKPTASYEMISDLD